MKKYIPFLIAGGLAALYFLRLKKTSEAVKVSLADVSIKKAKGFKLPTIILKFSILNPTSGIINILGVVGDVYINNVFLASVSNLNKAVVNPNTETIYEVQVNTTILDAVTNIVALLKNGKTINLTANMNINVDNILYPVTINRTIK
jgi:LEA14-like dessication related protein